MGGGDPRLGHELGQAGGGRFDVLHPVVDEEDLAVAQQLAADGGADLLGLVGADVGEDGGDGPRAGWPGWTSPAGR